MLKSAIKWSRPISKQWPLMLAYIVLIGWESVTKNPFPRWMLIFLHAYVVAALVEWSHSRVVKALAYVLIYVLFVTELGLDWLFGMHISPSVLVLMAETTGRESAEFLESLADKPGFWNVVGCTVVLAALNILAERMRETVCRWMERRPRTVRVLRVVAAVLLLGGIVGSAGYLKLFNCKEPNDIDEWRSHMRHPDDALTKLVVAGFDIHLARNEMEQASLQAEQVTATPQTAGDDSINVILVIGESYIREHTPLYGYPLQTTPFLSEEQRQGRLFVFTDAVSPYNQTTKVLRNLLCCNSMGDGETWNNTPPFMAVFKKNGYWVGMEDNQKTMSLGDVFAFSLNAFLYHPRMMSACYDEVNDSTFEYDGQLVENYRRRHSQPSDGQSRRLLLFHLMGQHVGYRHRYPGERSFQHFTADSTAFRHETWLTKEMREEIAHYDNATLYNDYVLQQIAGLYSNENTVMVLLSDHGEEVYDYRDSYGRDDWALGDSPREVLRWQYCVPFMVWCSERFCERHPELTEQLEKSTDRPLMLDNTCQLLFRLAGLQTPYYHSKRDVLSDDYQCPRRIINDEYDFDELKLHLPFESKEFLPDIVDDHKKACTYEHGNILDNGRR